MRALLKNNEWVEIDTTVLFENQYNTTVDCGNRRIFDKDILKIEDDVRFGKGKCKYCGKIVEQGKEEEHFLEEENKKCSLSVSDKCFWKRKKYLSQNVIDENTVSSEENSVHTEVVTTKKEFKYIFFCEHNEIYGGCDHERCRKYGIEWFTKNNCYFLAYPSGIMSYLHIDSFNKNKWVETHKDYRRYEKLIQNNVLKAEFFKGRLKHFELYNCRRSVRFNFDPIRKHFVVYDSLGYKITNNVLSEGKYNPKCNVKVNETIKCIMKDLYKE